MESMNKPGSPPVSPGTVFRWAVAAALGVAAVWVSTMALWAVRDVIVLVMVALFVAVSLDPATRWLVRHRVRRPYAVAVIFLIALLMVTGVVALVGPPLVQQITDLSDDLPGYLSELDEQSETFRQLSDRYGLSNHLTQFVSGLPQRIGQSVLDFFRRFLGVLASTLLVLVLTVYFMADLPRIRRQVPRLFPQRCQQRAGRVVDVVVDKVGNYMIGGLLVSTIAGTVAYIGLSMFRVPFALPLSLLIFLTAFIPLIGASLGATICVVVAAIANGLWPDAALVLLFFLVYQQLENYVIAPRIMQGRMDLPAVAVLVAGLLGGTLLGLVGALMAIPVAAAVKAVVSEVRKTRQETQAPAID